MEDLLTTKSTIMKRKKLKIILAIIVITLAGGGFYAWREFNRKVKDLTYVKAGAQMEAEALIKVFEANEAKGNSEYLDKIIAVKGKIRTVEKSASGYYTVVLGTENDMSSIRCSMDSVHQMDVATLAKGSSVTMKGACTGFNKDELLGSDVILNRCVVEN